MTTYLLCDRNAELIEAWKEAFAGYKNVMISSENIFRTPCQAIVSPANSSGTMRGGLDFFLSVFFDKNREKICAQLKASLDWILSGQIPVPEIAPLLDWTIEKKVKRAIQKNSPHGLSVGEAVLVETGYAAVPYLIAAPTMVFPQDISGTENIYRATKAIIAIAEKFQYSPVLIPGLGTGTGRMPPEECARQMRMAFAEVYLV